jgi:hypothetical protein
MIGLLGLAILTLTRKAVKSQMSIRFLVVSGLATAISVPLLFMVFSLMRGTNNWNDQITTFLGYTVSSYNRLAAIMNGRLRYPFAGHGMYLSGVVAHSSLLPFSKMIRTPDSLDVWAAEFGAVSQAGLDGRLVWSGAFGYIFAELGWFSFVFVFGYGVLYGFVWKWIKSGTVKGVVLYPWFGFCILFWLGTNYLLDQPMEVFVAIAIGLTVFEHLCGVHYTRSYESTPILGC